MPKTKSVKVNLSRQAMELLALLRVDGSVSYQELQKQTGYNRRQVQVALSELLESGVITIN